MKRLGPLISKYLLRAVIPYFVFSWLLLSVILFVQQAGRFTDIFFSVNIPATLVWQLMIALVPNVIAFTCPMAVLVGTIIGLAKMQGDSELVAIRAAGVGNLQISLPIIALGVLLSIFAFFVNLKGVPLAAALVRQVALKTAIHKLESPIEPGIFNTEVAGYTIYVRGGDMETGRWQNIFVYHEDPAAGSLRLITSKEGRLDVSEQVSELVLENATVSTLPTTAGAGKYVTENIGDVRLAIRTRRNELVERLSSAQSTPEELGLSELSQYAASREGRERVEAQILWERRIVLSITPLIFCLLGSAMVLRFNRGGRGFGTFLALLGLVVYYLLAFLGEQLARVGTVTVFEGALIPIVASVAVMLWIYFSRRFDLSTGLSNWLNGLIGILRRPAGKLQSRNILVDLTTGLRDLDLLINLAKYFFLTLGFMTVLSMIFTAFELWKFAGSMDGGVWLLAEYLVFLLPFVYLQYLAPTGAMIAVLATYVIKSRQNEIVTWIAAGQSIYRLLVPCLLATALLGFVNWEIQERVLPYSNPIQDALRTQIRNKGVVADTAGRYWLASNDRILSFEPPPVTSDNEKALWFEMPSALSGAVSASDNEIQLHNLRIYQFANNGGNLQFVYRAPSAIWTQGKLLLSGPVEKSSFGDHQISVEKLSDLQVVEENNPSLGISEKPSHLSIEALKKRIAETESDTEQRMFAVALERRYSTPLLPLIIAWFTAPFALSLSRKGKVTTIGLAVALWLLFIGVTSVFEQFGLNGYLSAGFAVWPPLALFAAFGVYLLFKVRT